MLHGTGSVGLFEVMTTVAFYNTFIFLAKGTDEVQKSKGSQHMGNTSITMSQYKWQIFEADAIHQAESSIVLGTCTSTLYEKTCLNTQHHPQLGLRRASHALISDMSWDRQRTTRPRQTRRLRTQTHSIEECVTVQHYIASTPQRSVYIYIYKCSRK